MTWRTTLIALFICCAPLSLLASKYASERDTTQSYLLFNTKPNVHGRSLIIGFHPEEYAHKALSRWKDSLLFLAKKYDATLLVPSGGADASLNSIGDFKFINRVVDSLLLQDKIDGTRILCVGERKGADEAIMYTLSDDSRATGALLYNPLQSGLTHVFKQLKNAEGKRILLIHHYKNFPNTRHLPLLQQLKRNQADVKSILVKAQMPNYHITKASLNFRKNLNWFFGPNTWALEGGAGKSSNYFSYDIPFKEFRANDKLGIYVVSGRPGVMQINILNTAGSSVYQHIYSFPKGKKHLVLPIGEIGYGAFEVEIRCPLGTKSERIVVRR